MPVGPLGRLALVEGDDQKPAVAVGRRGKDPRHPGPQEAVGGHQPARFTGLARRVVAVVAEVRGDEDERRRALGALEIGGQGVESHDAHGAVRRIDDRMEVHERVVADRVLVAVREPGARRLRRLRGVRTVQRRMAAGAADARRIVTHVLEVGAPRPAARGELIGQRLHARRVDAAGANGLAIGRDAGEQVVLVHLAVIPRGLRRRLAADHRDVVAEAEVGRAEVLAEQRTARRQRVREVRGLATGPERGLVALVLEHDQEDVTDGRQLRGRGHRRHDQECQYDPVQAAHGQAPKRLTPRW